MKPSDRIELLDPVLAQFPEMEGWNKAGLLKLAATELETGDIFPRSILHVISANTPMAGMQSLVRGLLLGSLNRCKIPSVGLPRFEEFVANLPPALAELVEISGSLVQGWQEEADAVVVFGTDETVGLFRKSTNERQIFAGYGDRWSGAVIFEDENFRSVPGLTQDICFYGQMGCLSAQIIWLHRSVDCLEYAYRLADSLARFSARASIQPLTVGESAAIARWRSAWEWQALDRSQRCLWFSDGEPTWGVALQVGDEPPGLSCLHRHVTLRLFENEPELGRLRSSLSTLSVWPDETTKRQVLAATGASRLCSVGRMQFPEPTWQQDGFSALGRLVRRLNVEG